MVLATSFPPFFMGFHAVDLDVRALTTAIQPIS